MYSQTFQKADQQKSSKAAEKMTIHRAELVVEKTWI
jgi:hypothetical protein